MNPQLADKLLCSSDDRTVGRYTYGNPKFVSFPSAQPVQIGKFCSIADEVTFISGGEHYLDRSTTYPLNLLFEDQKLGWYEKSKGSIIVGNDVWIGYGATILSGVIIGDGAIIGARSVVTRDVPTYEVWAGNPVEFIRLREKPDWENRDWWDWDIERIGANAQELIRSLD